MGTYRYTDWTLIWDGVRASRTGGYRTKKYVTGHPFVAQSSRAPHQHGCERRAARPVLLATVLPKGSRRPSRQDSAADFRENYPTARAATGASLVTAVGPAS